ncbi:hypothetical protein, partial [Wolbachia endosymbiont of Nasonia vitripennis]|uniref:hypothetical protein n=1 Tax=Wolbachia endosymbiont of Nasonia vitripennis TaxID=180837 RepID=UPI0002374DCA
KSADEDRFRALEYLHYQNNKAVKICQVIFIATVQTLHRTNLKCCKMVSVQTHVKPVLLFIPLPYG